MHQYNFLIIGFGSSGRRYAKILNKFKFKKKIFVFSRIKHSFNKIKNLKEIKKIKFDVVLICNETYKHFETLKIIDKFQKNTKILVEKPLFSMVRNYKSKTNKIYVGYNLRFDPIIEYLKNKLKNQTVNYINLSCLSHLPSWRKNIDYKKSYSSDYKKGGGVTNDLSHEIDLANYLVGIDKFKIAVKSKISNLKIKADDFSYFFGLSKDGNPILINLGFFFQIEKRLIFIKTKNKSYMASLDERKIIEKSDKKSKIRFFKINKNQTYLDMLNSIINDRKTKCCNLQEGLKINKIISKYKNI